jgi:hypothetical protein
MKRATHVARAFVLFLFSGAAAGSGCLSFEHKSTLGPTATGISALLGTWSSSNLIPAASSCTDFKWSVTDQTSTSASGSFSATCAGDLKASGTARGQMSGSLIAWSAEGNASAPGLTSCAISLTGTAEIQTDSIRVPYTGDTCLGRVSGVETLRRH